MCNVELQCMHGHDHDSRRPRGDPGGARGEGGSQRAVDAGVSPQSDGPSCRDPGPEEVLARIRRRKSATGVGLTTEDILDQKGVDQR